MSSRTEARTKRDQLIAEINVLANSIAFIGSRYFTRDGSWEIPRAGIDPRVSATMRERLLEFRVKHKALMAQLDDLDARVPELWYSR